MFVVGLAAAMSSVTFTFAATESAVIILKPFALIFATTRPEIGNGKADVVNRRADRAARRRLHRTEKDQNIRELDDLLLAVTGTDLRHGAAERVDKELLLRVHVRGVQMVVPVDDRTFSGNQNLRTGDGRREQQDG